MPSGGDLGDINRGDGSQSTRSKTSDHSGNEHEVGALGSSL